MDFEESPSRLASDEEIEADSPARIFRWEDSSGLEHSCFNCSMKMNNPKARQHCFGIHSIPCIRYHQTMHAIGTSHKCFSCIQCDEIHTNRHRKIAELLLEYKNYDQVERRVEQRSTVMRELPVNIQPRQMPRDLTRHENEPDYDLHFDDISCTSETSSTKLTQAEKRAIKKAAKDRKSIEKANKNQQKHSITIRDEDLEHIQNVLHGDQDDQTAGNGHPLTTDNTIEEVIARNLAFVNNIHDHQKYLLASVNGRREYERHQRERKRRTRVSQDHETKTEVVNAILLKLGVKLIDDKPEPNRVKHLTPKSKCGNYPTTPASKIKATGKKALVERLREAIFDDLRKDEHEKHETWVRAGGFWRYVGRPVFERMTEIAQRIDWRTGVITQNRDD